MRVKSKYEKGKFLVPRELNKFTLEKMSNIRHPFCMVATCNVDFNLSKCIDHTTWPKPSRFFIFALPQKQAYLDRSCFGSRFMSHESHKNRIHLCIYLRFFIIHAPKLFLIIELPSGRFFFWIKNFTSCQNRNQNERMHLNKSIPLSKRRSKIL